jgi:NitT/TauT family transport system substrate-binding protein
MSFRHAIAALLAAALISACVVQPSRADETLRVGKAVPESFAFVPLDIGMHEGLFKRNGIGIDEIAFAGDAKLQQAMAADSLDIALGSGPAMAFIAKGAPTKAIAAMGGPPLDLTIVVRPDGPKSAAELKGKKISVSTVGGLTYWLVSETSRQQGWGPDGIAIAPMGSMAPQIAALERGDIDGVVTDISTALELEKLGKARILTRFGQIVKDFHVHIIYATDKLIASKPDAIRAFLKGWFEAITFMRHNKAATVSIATQVIGKDDDINGKTYDELMPMFSDDGRFDAKALDTLAKSYVELKVLPTAPDMSKLYTEAFLPAK